MNVRAVMFRGSTFGFRPILTALCLMGIVTIWTVEGKIIGAFVLPHGGIAFDPLNFNTTNTTERLEAMELHRACVNVGQDLSALRPDLIFLSTPHGIADNEKFVFYQNSEGAGFADADDCLQKPCRLYGSVELDISVTAKLVSLLGTHHNVTGLSAFGPVGNNEPFPLRWGELIPLLFVPGLNTSKVVIMSQPSRRYRQDVAMVTELLKLGADISAVLEDLEERVAVLISADLAHTHQASGPYGYSNASEPFDLACGRWAESLDEDSLLVTATRYVDRALSCGYTGLVMLQGMLKRLGTASFHPRLYANLHPSYYGMMAVSMPRKT